MRGLVSHLVLQRARAVVCCPGSYRVTSACAELRWVPRGAFLCCSSMSSRISSSLGEDLWYCKICSNVLPMSELVFICPPQFSHRQEDGGESGYQEALPPVSVGDLCQESVQRAHAVEAHATRERKYSLLSVPAETRRLFLPRGSKSFLVASPLF